MAPFFIRGRFHHNNKRFKSPLMNVRKHKKCGMRNMQERFEKLRAEMEEISVEQQNIRDGQRHVREKFEVIETECEELKRETKIIIQQSARTQIKLALMFQILKASKRADYAAVATFTHLLREIIGRE